MRYRTLGRLGWQVSEIGYGMWGMAGWTGSDDDETRPSASSWRSSSAATSSTPPGPTATATASSCSARLLRAIRRARSTSPPRSRRRIGSGRPRRGIHARRRLPARLHPRVRREEPGEPRRRRRSTCSSSTSGKTPGPRTSAGSARVDDLKREGADPRRRHQRQPLGAGQRARAALDTGLIDAVQVIYNIFDQAPEDELFPLCREHGIAVIARVPFDEGTLTGTLDAGSRPGRRATGATPTSCRRTWCRASRTPSALSRCVPTGMTHAGAGAALHPGQARRVSTIIPGMRKPRPRRGQPRRQRRPALDDSVRAGLRRHRWDREPAWWSG